MVAIVRAALILGDFITVRMAISSLRIGARAWSRIVLPTTYVVHTLVNILSIKHNYEIVL